MKDPRRLIITDCCRSRRPRCCRRYLGPAIAVAMLPVLLQPLTDASWSQTPASRSTLPEVSSSGSPWPPIVTVPSQTPSDDATELARSSHGACIAYDTWAPVLASFLTNYRPHSITSDDTWWTFASNPVTSLMQVRGTAGGRRWFRSGSVRSARARARSLTRSDERNADAILMVCMVWNPSSMHAHGARPIPAPAGASGRS